jgi:hypothetical protein
MLFPSHLQIRKIPTISTLTLSTLLSGSSRRRHLLWNHSQKKAPWIIFMWTNIYSEIRLTYPDTDKFPAFGAIAEYHCRRFNDECIAGFLKCHLPLGLGWRMGDIPSGPLSDSVSSDRSPSWSWIKSDVITSIPSALPRRAPHT